MEGIGEDKAAGRHPSGRKKGRVAIKKKVQQKKRRGTYVSKKIGLVDKDVAEAIFSDEEVI